jgi:nicotinate-nucleotide adenylyltransferase
MKTSNPYALIGIFGGTFNPIHYGHLRIAQELAEQLNLLEVKFIPSANPPHKTTPTASAVQRAKMVELAIMGNPLFTLDMRELERDHKSYTIDTLKSLHTEEKHAALCLIMGSDAFLTFDTWHQWQDILNYCHIILVGRPNNTAQQRLSAALETYMREHYIEDIKQLSLTRGGYISMQSVTTLDISSSKIRNLVHQQLNPIYLSPSAVIDYIQQQQLYM